MNYAEAKLTALDKFARNILDLSRMVDDAKVMEIPPRPVHASKPKRNTSFAPHYDWINL